MTKRFASWAAVSSLPQAKKISLEDQLATNREHIKRHRGKLVAELVVPGESRSIVLFEEACRRIEAYEQLRQLIADRAFDVLIYLDRSRLGRKASLSMAVVELCHAAGIFTYETESPPANLDTPRNSSYDDMLVGAIKSVGAQREIIKLQERHQAGMIGRVKAGKFPAAVPWGWVARYDAEGNRHIEIDKEAASVIRMMLLEMYLEQGNGHVQIAERLNQRGICTPQGVEWEKQNVQGIMRRLWRYAGWSEVNVKSDRPYTRARGNWPAILTDEEAQAIADEKEMRRNARRAVSNTYRFSLCVWCRTCGRRMIMATNVRQRKSRRIQKSLRCKGDHLPKFISEPKVVRAVRQAIKFLQKAENRQAILQDRQPTQDLLSSQIADVKSAIEKTNAGILKADDAYVSGEMDYERYKRQLDRLKGRLEAQEKQLEKLNQQNIQQEFEANRANRLDEFAANGLAYLETDDLKAANAFFRHHIKIWVENRQVVEIEYL